ncbi:hypothetical protein BH09PAT1_BH09PAT1_1050 [soil metagenome]
MAEAVLDREQLAKFRIVRPESIGKIIDLPTIEKTNKFGSALAKRAELAMSSLETGEKVLTIGPDLLSQKQRHTVQIRGVAIVDESELTEIPEETFNLVIGNLETDDLANTIPAIKNLAADHADMYFDIYDTEPFANNDVLDDELRRHDFYLRGTQAESRGESHHMQVDAIRMPRGEISKGIRRSNPGTYYTGPTWEKHQAYPGDEME